MSEREHKTVFCSFGLLSPYSVATQARRGRSVQIFRLADHISPSLESLLRYEREAAVPGNRLRKCGNSTHATSSSPAARRLQSSVGNFFPRSARGVCSEIYDVITRESHGLSRYFPFHPSAVATLSGSSTFTPYLRDIYF